MERQALSSPVVEVEVTHSEEWEDSVDSEADSQEEMQMTFSRISLVDVIHLRTSSMTTS